jgi:hypothetical protein
MFMKRMLFLLGTGLIPLLAGCSTNSSTTIAPVGPSPATSQNAVSSAAGSLEVFSRVAKQHDDREEGGDGMPGWSQHVAYTVYDTNGRAVKHVENSAAHYTRAPERVTLAPGKYIVKAQAADYSRVNAPVIIESGRTTRVHLDDNWKPPADTPKDELVTMPDGRPVGWVTMETAH